MSAIHEVEEEKPLDPATEKVRRKMMRLLVVSIGIMMAGLMAVLGAIVYKIGGKPDATNVALQGFAIPGEPGFEGRIDLAQGARIVSASLDGDNVLLQVQLENGTAQLLVHSLTQNRIIAKIAID